MKYEKIISCDTDGIYVNQDINLKSLNKYLDDLTQEKFNLTNFLHLEQDDFSAGFFRPTHGKQYILVEGEKLLFHGVSFKGSHMPKFWDDLLEEIARDMFNGITERKKVDIKKYTINEISQSISVKNEKEYKNKSSLAMQLIQKAKNELNMELIDGDQLSYVKCRRGYELVTPDKTDYDIDYKYYESIVNKVYERLDIVDSRQIRFE